MNEEAENTQDDEIEDDEEYPPGVTDPSELPMTEPAEGSDGNDQEVAELPEIDDDPDPEVDVDSDPEEEEGEDDEDT